MFRIIQFIKDLLRGASFGSIRDNRWPGVRKLYLKDHPVCEACGKKDKLTVHHKHPFFLFPSDELNPENLITLCEGKIMNCHFVFGHCFLTWKCYNPNVVEDVKIISNLRKNAKTEKSYTLE